MNAYRYAPLRHIAPVPAPIRSGRNLYWFHPELTVGFCGVYGEVRPLAAPRLIDVLAVCPHQAVITRKRHTAITALWKLPDIPPPWVESDEPPSVPPIPDFVVRDACAAIETA